MEKIGIPIIDSVLEIFDWSKSEEYKKIEERYGEAVKQILVELILLPLLKFESINDMAQAIGRHPNEYYDLLKDRKIDWMWLLIEFTQYFFLSLLKVYQKSESRSFQSRWRIRIAIDDTLIRRWSRKMGGSHCVWNYIDKYYMYGQNILCLAVIVGKDKFVFPLLCEISDSRCFVLRRTKTERVIEALQDLHKAAQEEGLSFQGLRLVSDSSYSTEDIVKTAKELGFKYVGTAKSKWNFTLKDGTEIKCSDLHKGNIPEKVRQSSRITPEYYRLIAYHATLGTLVLCIFACSQTDRSKYQRYWVYISPDLDMDCISVYREQKIRWKIETMFKTFKRTLGIRFYQGISRIGQNAWFALTCLRFIFVQLAFKVSSRFPSLRWNILKKRFGLSTLIRYIRDHYHLDSKYFGIKRLHYSLVLSKPSHLAFKRF